MNNGYARLCVAINDTSSWHAVDDYFPATTVVVDPVDVFA